MNPQTREFEIVAARDIQLGDIRLTGGEVTDFSHSWGTVTVEYDRDILVIYNHGDPVKIHPRS